jgi:4-carboxymuconolactone decarboxylase
MSWKILGCVAIVTTFILACNQVKNNSRVINDSHLNPVFPKGTRITNDNFTGAVWVQMMVTNDSVFNTSVGNVTFEPGSRTNWHYHPGGQILLVTSGKGRYGEEGKPVKHLQKGDVIKCTPNTKHWHGAAPDSELSHIAIGTNTDNGAVVWLQPVSNEEYNNLP